jgi:hypothetical protein
VGGVPSALSDVEALFRFWSEMACTMCTKTSLYGTASTHPLMIHYWHEASAPMYRACSNEEGSRKYCILRPVCLRSVLLTLGDDRA